MKTLIVISLLFSLAIVGGVALAQDDSVAESQNAARISFPIEELGGCASKDECKQYCAQEDNKEACMDFAEEHDLLPQDRIVKFKEFRSRLEVRLEEEDGPGGCTSISECREYCLQEDNRVECLEFGLSSGLLPEQAAEQAKKIILLKTVGGPGACTTPGECREYCSQDENKEECLSFAEEHDLLPEERLKAIEEHRVRIEERLKSVSGPGGCTSREECKTYCEDPANTQECVTFGQEHNLINRERAMETLKKLREGAFEEYKARFEEKREGFQNRLEEARKKQEQFRMEFRERLEGGDENTLEQRERVELRGDGVRYEYEQRMKDGRIEVRERLRTDDDNDEDELEDEGEDDLPAQAGDELEDEDEDEEDIDDIRGSNSGSGSILQFVFGIFGL